MPSLKDFRVRITSVKNTRKITSAMKMVAASKLRQAQARAEAGRPYAKKMSEALSRLVQAIGEREESTPLLDGTGKDKTHLFVVISADRGLAGGFNSNLVRDVKRKILAKKEEGKTVKILTVGRKARDLLRRDFPDDILESLLFTVSYATAETVTQKVITLFNNGEFDEAHVAYSEFKNVITQVPTLEKIVPFDIRQRNDKAPYAQVQNYQSEENGYYMFEPDAMTLLTRLIPQQIGAKLYSILLEVGAGEQAARMTAMDNATRNAGDMINGLTLQYNRARQAYITKEVSEIVAGAEASA